MRIFITLRISFFSFKFPENQENSWQVEAQLQTNEHARRKAKVDASTFSTFLDSETNTVWLWSDGQVNKVFVAMNSQQNCVDGS